MLGAVESKLFAYLVSFVTVSFLMFKKFVPRFSVGVLKECLKYGLPLIFVGLSTTILTLADRYFLKELRDLYEVGIYTMAYKFGMVINIALVTPFRQAFFPLMFKLAESANIKNLYRWFLLYFLSVACWFFLGISLFSKEILTLVTSPDYVSGYIIIPIITFSYLLFGVRLVFTTVLASQKRTGVIAYSTIWSVLANILLNLLLIPTWGIMGASIATLLSYLFLVVLTYIPQQRIIHIDWDWKRSGKLIAFTIIIFGISLLYSPTNIYIAVIWKAALLMSFPLILFVAKFFHPSEVENLKRIFRRMMGSKILKGDKKLE